MSIVTDKSKAIEVLNDLLENTGSSANDILRYLIHDYMSGSDALDAMKTYKRNELGIEDSDDEEDSEYEWQSIPNGGIKARKPLGKLYSGNQEVYDKVVDLIREKNITEFVTQASLYCFIEKIKFPHIRKGYYRIDYENKNLYNPKNYETIVDHLIANGIINHPRFINRKYVYSVVMVSPAEPSKVDSTATTENYFQNLNKIDMPAVPGDKVSSQPQPVQEPTSQQKVIINNTSKNLEELLHLSKKRIHIGNAINSLMKCSIKDQFMRCSIKDQFMRACIYYNLTVLAKDIEKAISELQSSILTSAEEEYNNIIK